MTPLRIKLPSGMCVCLNPLCEVPRGLCHCGCKKETPLAPQSSRKWGTFIGEPIKYIKGHNATTARADVSQEEAFLVGEDVCRHIPLTRGQFATVIAYQFEEYMRWNWHAKFIPKLKVYYAERSEIINGREVSIPMHRQMLGLGPGNPTRGDHENGDTLDNRPRNLRPATFTENCRNRRHESKTTSGYVGVTFNKEWQKWVVRINVNYRSIFIGYFVRKQDAIAARKKAELKYFGKFCRKHKA